MMRLWASAFFMSLVALSAFISVVQLGLPAASMPALVSILGGVVVVGGISGLVLFSSLRHAE